MKKLVLSVLAFVAFWGVAVGQADSHTDNHTVTIKIPNVGLLDIEPAASKNITFDLTAAGVIPTEAGSGFTWTALTNNTLWLNISSVKSPSKLRKIDVKATNLPAGINLNLLTATAVNNGKGNLGTAQITTATALTTSDQTLVNGIKTAYSGTGSGSGYQLTYSLSEPATAVYENLENNATTGHVVTVTYTLVEY